MPIQTVLFDLDGTLTDPGEGITKSVAYALHHLGIEIPNRSVLYSFIGPPLTESFMKYYGFTEEQAKEAVDIYREYFAVTGLFENSPYSGISSMLADLQARGINLIVASSKPEVFVRKILDHFKLSQYFLFAAGSELNHSRIDKHEVIEYALTSCQIANRNTCLMVGDRYHDIQGAKQSSLLSIGVTYGYGTYRELKEAGANYIVNTVTALTDCIKNLT